MSRLTTLAKPLAREGASVPETILEDVLVSEWHWARAQVADLLRELRKHV